MSINTAHIDDNITIYLHEYITIVTRNDSSITNNSLLKGKRQGRLILTTHRLIFLSKRSKDAVRSLNMPVMCLTEIELIQPCLSPNYMKAVLTPIPPAGLPNSECFFHNTANIKFNFPSGGAIKLFQALKEAQRILNFRGITDTFPHEAPTEDVLKAEVPVIDPIFFGLASESTDFNPPQSIVVYIYSTTCPYPGIIQQEQIAELIQQPSEYYTQDQEMNPQNCGQYCQPAGYVPPGNGPPPQAYNMPNYQQPIASSNFPPPQAYNEQNGQQPIGPINFPTAQTYNSQNGQQPIVPINFLPTQIYNTQDGQQPVVPGNYPPPPWYNTQPYNYPPQIYNNPQPYNNQMNFAQPTAMYGPYPAPYQTNQPGQYSGNYPVPETGSYQPSAPYPENTPNIRSNDPNAVSDRTDTTNARQQSERSKNPQISNQESEDNNKK